MSATRGTSRLQAKLDAALKNKNYYEAQQLYKTIYNRYLVSVQLTYTQPKRHTVRSTQPSSHASSRMKGTDRKKERGREGERKERKKELAYVGATARAVCVCVS